MFKKEILLENIKFLTKKKGIMVGDLEERIGVSKGYISRINKKNDGVATGIDIILRIAQELGVSLEVLLCVDLRTLDENKQYTLNFLKKLELKTDEQSVIWKKIIPNQVKMMMDGGPSSGLPMLRIASGQNPILVEDYQDIKEIYYSDFFGYGLVQETAQYPAKTWFSCEIDKKTTIYITYMVFVENEGREQEIYEMYIDTYKYCEEDDGYGGTSAWHEHINTPFFCSAFSEEEIKDAMISLYGVIEQHQNDTKIPDDIKIVLDGFMA